jgi:intracellular septation protein A
MNKTKKGIIFTILINAGGPFLAYTLLKDVTGSIFALTIAALIPLCDSLFSLIKTKKVDIFSSFIFVGIALSIIAALIGGNEKFILLRESYVTGIMGCLFLVSLFSSKPLIYLFSSRFSDNPSVLTTRWNEEAFFRKSMRLMTLVWGICLLLEAILKVILVYTLSVTTFLAVSPFFYYGILGLTIYWTIRYTRFVKSKYSK